MPYLVPVVLALAAPIDWASDRRLGGGIEWADDLPPVLREVPAPAPPTYAIVRPAYVQPAYPPPSVPAYASFPYAPPFVPPPFSIGGGVPFGGPGQPFGQACPGGT